MSGFQDRIYPALPVFAQNLACTLGGLPARARALHAALPPHARGARSGARRGRSRRCTRSSASGSTGSSSTRDATSRYYRELAARRATPRPARGDPRARSRRSPPLEKATYRDRREEFIARDLAARRLIRGKTSGTTGTALPLWYTPEALAEEFATLLARGAALRRASSGDPNLTFTGQIDRARSRRRARPSGAPTTGRARRSSRSTT